MIHRNSKLTLSFSLHSSIEEYNLGADNGTR